MTFPRFGDDTQLFTASAPGRGGILGNPSDIYGGVVLSCSVPVRATCRLTLNVDTHLPEDLRLWNAAVARFPLNPDVAVKWQTDVPRSSGLSGSTALLAATLACVLQARDQAPDLGSTAGLAAFAELVRDVERNEAGIVCGYQDAYMIVHGGLQLMNFAGKHPVKPGPPATLCGLEAQLPFLLITTGVERLSGSVHGPMAERWMAGEKLVVDGIKEIAGLAEPGADYLLTGNYSALARLMTRNQEIITALGGSGDAIDELIAKAMKHGALAVKLAGAGMGGTVIALTENPSALTAALRAEGYSRFLRPSIEAGVRPTSTGLP